MVFPVVMYGCESWAIKKAGCRGYSSGVEHLTAESWAPKNWWFWRVVLEKTLESPLDCKEIQPVTLKWNQPWIVTGKTDAETEATILWPPDVKNRLNGKDPDTGKDWRQKERRTTEDETVGWHHQLNRHEFDQALSVGDGQGSLVCCRPWGPKELDMTEWLNWTDLIQLVSKRERILSVSLLTNSYFPQYSNYFLEFFRLFILLKRNFLYFTYVVVLWILNDKK